MTTNELCITQFISAKPATVWQIMTGQLESWWCPKPWRVQIDAIDWRAGGAFNTTMHGPEGEEIPGIGVLLEVTPGKRLVFTDALDSDWQPKEAFMVGMMEIAAEGNGTRYTARARHWNEKDRIQHVSMGFTEGWQTVARQLAHLAEQADGGLA
mgnify:CR=1 FL=1